MLKIRLTSQSYVDLVDIWSYIAQDNLKSADEMLDNINQEIKLIANSPEIGRARYELAKNLRSLAVSNYVIFYRLHFDEIQIIRILHGSRDIKSIIKFKND